MYFTSDQISSIGLAVAALAVVGATYIRQRLAPPSLDDIQTHLDKADNHFQKHVEAKGNAAAAADAHVAAKQTEIAGLASAIATAQGSIDQAKSLVGESGQ